LSHSDPTETPKTDPGRASQKALEYLYIKGSRPKHTVILRQGFEEHRVDKMKSLKIALPGLTN